MANEFICQPIEQLWMGWSGSKLTKIVARSNETSAKMVLPNPVDYYPSGQWIFCTGDPVGNNPSFGSLLRRLEWYL